MESGLKFRDLRPTFVLPAEAGTPYPDLLEECFNLKLSTGGWQSTQPSVNVSDSPADGPPQLPTSLPTAPEGRPWSIHIALIGAYPLIVGLAGVGRPEGRQPALTHGVKGFLIVCAVEVLVFGTVFGLAWLASRASRDDLLLRWQGGFWAVPLGIGYSVALRFALGIVTLIVAGFLILMHVMTSAALKNFAAAIAPDIGSLVDISALKNNPA